MANLYEIAAEHNATFLALLEMDEIDDETFESTMAGIEGELEEKAKSVAAFFQNIQADVDAMKDAEKRIAERRKAIENKANRLKEYLRDNMAATGINKIECPEFKITLRKPSDIVNVYDAEAVPSDYLKTTVTVNKVEIKKALKEGLEVSGAKLEKGKPSLLIK